MKLYFDHILFHLVLILVSISLASSFSVDIMNCLKYQHIYSKCKYLGRISSQYRVGGIAGYSSFNQIFSPVPQTSLPSFRLFSTVTASQPVTPNPNSISSDKLSNVTLTQQYDDGFDKLGLDHRIVNALNELKYTEPTKVQKVIIPRILNNESVVLAATTGSGKTLAFILPVLQLLMQQEAQGYVRKPSRPRCIILAPTRELAEQILEVSWVCFV